MRRVKETRNFVMAELKENYSSRTNDNELILGVLRRFGVDTTVPFCELLSGRLPTSLASITRARRKIQEEHPELKDAETVIIRREEEEQYHKFAKENL